MGSQRLIGASWIVARLVGVYLAMGYDFTPGRLGPRLATWPMDTQERASTAS